MIKKIKIAVTVLLLSAGFLILMPQQVNAQVSDEALRLLRIARIQVFTQRTEPRDFTLQLLSGGNAALSSYRGNVVILNFWATWCPPCRAEMPSMETLYQRYRNQGLEILAVDIRETTNTVRQFISTNGFSFPVLLDLDGRVSVNYGVEAIPTTYIIDREGKMIGRIVGSIHWDTPEVFAAFEALLRSR